MKDIIPRTEIRDTLALLYRERFDSWFRLMEEAKAALQDGDEEAHKALSRRADKRSDFMDGIKAAAEALGIDPPEFMAAVNADRTEER